MHLSEFKAWFDGFTEDMNGPPNKDQWAKIKKRVKEITADYTPTPFFIDRYVRPYRRYWDDIYYAKLSDNTAADQTITRWSAAGSAEYKASL